MQITLINSLFIHALLGLYHNVMVYIHQPVHQFTGSLWLQIVWLYMGNWDLNALVQ